ncbi:MAG: FAD:protein FMN transferase, partial [Firmicutes bacterium]|nr:FAD:protein FMN transferase [Bacillota bacterium]
LYHHVLDPRTGYPVETDLLSATVTGPSSETCDILSTTCLLLGSEKAMELIGSQDGYEAVLILQDRSILQTENAFFTAQ